MKRLSFPDIWKDKEYEIQCLKKEVVSLNNNILMIDNLDRSIKELNELLELMLKECFDRKLFSDIQDDVADLEHKMYQLELDQLFFGKYDNSNCYMDIQSGSGGVDAQDWARMLLRMYFRWTEYKGLHSTIITESLGEIAGLKSVTIYVVGDYAYGWLRTETGIHRLIRKSPFDSGRRRHTSFASVFVYPEITDNKINVKINLSDLRIDVYRASGAGGQHVNKTESAVRITHLPTNIVTQCQNDRSQHKNKEQAMRQLRLKLYNFELQKHLVEKKIIEQGKLDITWGSQIRSYILDNPRVKDIRTGIESYNVLSVLDGNLDQFVKASLRLRL